MPEDKTLEDQIKQDIQNLVKIPVAQPVGAEKMCETIHKNMLLKYFKMMVVENKVQNVKIFLENITECKLLGEKEDRIDAVLQFNGEKCFAGVTYGSENGVPQYNMLSTK